VRIVDEMIPPITTVASGRCTSAPAPVAIAIGTKPRDATSAVIKTDAAGSTHLPDRIDQCMSFPSEFFDERDDNQTVEDCHAGESDEADPGADGQRDSS
jgi:hypothetical protein